MAAWLFRPRHDGFLAARVPDYSRWQHLFEASETPSVVVALGIIRDAFLLSDEDIFRLLPEDRLIDLYHATYPHGGADAMEFEELDLMLSRAVGVAETDLQRLGDATVGDIIQFCLKTSTKAT